MESKRLPSRGRARSGKSITQAAIVEAKRSECLLSATPQHTIFEALTGAEEGPSNLPLEVSELTREAFHRPGDYPTLRQFMLMSLADSDPGAVIYGGRIEKPVARQILRAEQSCLDRAVIDLVLMPQAVRVTAARPGRGVRISHRQLKAVNKKWLGPEPHILACCPNLGRRIRREPGFSSSIPGFPYAGEFGSLDGFRLVEVPHLNQESFLFSEAVGYETLVRGPEVVKTPDGPAWVEEAAFGPLEDGKRVIAWMALDDR